MICKKCGTHSRDDVKFCRKCGSTLTAPARIRITMPEKPEVEAVSVKKEAPHVTAASPRIRITMPEKPEVKTAPIVKGTSEKTFPVVPGKKAAETKTVRVPEKKAVPEKKKEQPMTMAARATRNDKPTMASMAVLEDQKRREFMAAPLKEKRRMVETFFCALMEEYRAEHYRPRARAVA